MLSYEYIQFLNEKLLNYLPVNRVKVGNKYNFRCPLCGDSRKSSTKKRGWLYLATSSYYCFNCSTGMSGIKLLEILSGQDYAEIRKEYTRLFLKTGLKNSLSSSYVFPSDEPSLFEMKSVINPEWKNPLSDRAKDYLEKRKVLDAPFLSDQLYSCYSKSKREEFILIPWIINGCEAYYQVNDFLRQHSMKYVFPKDKKKLIAGLDNIDLSFPYIICFEGYYDSVFVKNGVCLGTKAITDYQLKLIKERYPHHQIVISFDNDSSGLDSMANLLRKDYDFKYFKWFDKNTREKDINDYVLAKNDVNIFSDQTFLEKLIVDKLMMKMYLIQNHMWTPAHVLDKKEACVDDQNSFWKKRKIQ